MLELKSVSKCKRDAIQEAIIESEKIKNKKSSVELEDFEARMTKCGWEHIGKGGFKTCLSKGTIILKYASYPDSNKSIGEVNREFEQWKNTPSKFKRHLTKTYALINGTLIQDRVLQKCGKFCSELNKVITEHPNLMDARQNHGHSLRGKLKFFDWVYNRTWDFVYSPDRELVEK
ncbi:hypothetical protein LCGC14_1810800 [marine sediment metagenome]|uniref:Uncharacterized protein n=1 Tax=marine sediment metagenome TaxID=412755 RepID=A0A0F9J1M6_9ZZZZ